MKIKELTWLKILAYPGMLFIFFVVYIFLPYVTWLGMPVDVRESSSIFVALGPGTIACFVLVFILGGIGIYGLTLLVRLLNRVERGDIFTKENAAAITKMDKVVLWGLGVAIVLDIAYLAFMHFDAAMFIPFVFFTLFLLVGHLLLKPLAAVVARSAELQEDLDLTV